MEQRQRDGDHVGFFFSSRRRHTRLQGDWSSDVCSSDLTGCPIAALAPEIARAAPAVKKRIAAAMKARRGRMLEFMPGRTADERERSFNKIGRASCRERV